MDFWCYERRDVEEARRDLKLWLEKWASKYPKLCAWVETHIEETWTFYRSPLAHHKHLKSSNLLERFNQEIKRRTRVVRIFPDEASCLRLVRAVAAETHEEWMEGNRYLNTDMLRERLQRWGRTPPRRWRRCGELVARSPHRLPLSQCDFPHDHFAELDAHNSFNFSCGREAAETMASQFHR